MSGITHRLNLTAKDRGAAERHRRAVETFVDEWVRDPETQQIFTTLRKDAGLGRKVTALRFVEAVTKRMPFPDLARVKRRIGSTVHAYVDGRTKGQYPWLAPQLVLAFVRNVGERAYGKPATLRYRVESLAPKPTLFYNPPAGLSTAEVMCQAKAALRQFQKDMRQYEHDRRGNSRSPRPNIARNVVWLYRHTIQGVPQPELSREYCATAKPSGDGHENVCQGIQQAARLLGNPLPRRKTNRSKSCP